MGVKTNRATWLELSAAAGINSLSGSSLTVEITVSSAYGKNLAKTTVSNLDHETAIALLSKALSLPELQTKPTNFTLVDRSITNSGNQKSAESTKEDADKNEVSSAAESQPKISSNKSVESEVQSVNLPKGKFVDMEDPFGNSVSDECVYAWSNLIDLYATMGADLARRCYAFKSYHHYSVSRVRGLLDKILSSARMTAEKTTAREVFEQNQAVDKFDEVFKQLYKLNAYIAAMLYDRLHASLKDPNMSANTALADVSNLFESLSYYEDTAE